jgi:glycosyltransferase involved in cell wall biosynthesis
MHSLSAVIITFNEEQNIGRCIQSVKEVADEVIVLDSWSTDRTAEIARSMGAIVHLEKFRGYIGQKNYALKLATHNYILSLDADEVLDPKLVSSILREKTSFSHRAYYMNRCTNFCGRFIRHGLWYPDRKTRLFDRTIATWGGLNPHDRIELQQGFTAGKLEGDILHFSFNTVEDLVWQNNRLSSIAASSLYSKGTRSTWAKMLLHPAWAFINGFVLRMGFLDGFNGFSIAVHTSHQVFQKYSKLYRMQHAPKHSPVATLAKPAVPGTKAALGEN